MDSKFLNRQLICWLSYNPYFEDGNNSENRVCYIYPRYIVNSGRFERIDSKREFPTVGRIAVRLFGAENAGDLYQRLGPLVSARINTDPQPYYSANNYYTLRYNPAAGRERSEIWLDSVDSTSFYEIKDSSQNINSILHYHECEPNYGDTECFSNAIMLRIGNMLYGPFDYTLRSGVLKLRGLERFDYMIGGYSIAEYDHSIITICDHRDRDAVFALPTASLTAPQDSTKCYDMIDQHHLVDVFLERVRTKMGLSRTDMRALNQFCDELLKGQQHLDLSEQRLNMIKALLPQVLYDEDLYLKMIKLTLDHDEFRQHLISDLVSADGDKLIAKLPSTYVNEVKAALLGKTQETLLAQPEIARALKRPVPEKKQAKASVPTVKFDLLSDGQVITNIKSLLNEGNFILNKLNDIYSGLALAADPDSESDIVGSTSLHPSLIAHFMDIGGLIVKINVSLSVILHTALSHGTFTGENKQELQSLSDALDSLQQNLKRRIAELQSSKLLAEYTKNKGEALDAAPNAALTQLNHQLESTRAQLQALQEQNQLLQSHNQQLTNELSLYDANYAQQMTSGNNKPAKTSARVKRVVEQAAAQLKNEQAKKELEKLEATIATKQQESKELNLKITAQNNEITAQNQTLEELLAQSIELENQNSELQNHHNELVKQNEQQAQKISELERKLKDSLKEYQDGAAMAVKLIDAKIMSELMAKGTASANPSLDQELRKSEVSSDETMAKLAPNFDTKLLAEVKSVDSAAKILERVCCFLNEVGHRNLDINDVANYLICITQGFITTFAGEPGTGKTSLCNLLARALGLARGKGASRFSEVSVERGWTSLKDLIGYYNPLTKRMEKSNAEIFDAFVNLNREAQWASDGSAYDRAKIAPYFILLDEANLSPIEHYWAAFFRNCDFSPLSQRTISLGGNANWLLPEHLRFLATVNFDHTTEELSPRFLDRSWVITLEPKVVEMNKEEYPDHDKSMVPFESLLTAFSAHDGDKLDEPLADKWRAIQAIFAHEKCALPLSPRNIRMVHNYCLVAARCMSRATTSTKFAPLDYAVAQKILPTINGSGERYRYLITELQKECTEQTMPLCARHLKRIERTGGAELGFYQFFAR